MKSQTDLHEDYGDHPIGHIDAVIIGKGILKEKLEKSLFNRGLSTTSCQSQQDLDMSLSPDFIFWIPESADEIPREAFLNFVRFLQARLTIVSSSKVDNGALDKCLQNDIDARVVVLHDLYGPHLHNSNLSFLWSKISSGKVIVPENETTKVAPLFIDDAADALSLSAFSSQTYGNVLEIAGAEDVTLLSFAYKLRDSVIRVAGKSPKMEESNKSYKEAEPHQEKILARTHAFTLLSWKPDIDLREGIEELVVSEIGLKKKSKLKPDVHHGERTTSIKSPGDPKKKNNLKLFGAIIAAIGIFIILFLSPVLAQVALERDIEHLLSRLEEESQNGVNGKTSSIEKSIIILSSVGENLHTVSRLGWRIFGKTDVSWNMHKFFSDAPLIADAKKDIGVLKSRTSALSEAVVGNSSGQPDALFSDLEKAATSLIGKLAMVSDSGLGGVNSRDLRRMISFGRNLFPIGQWALGFDRKRTFAVVVENSSELRPTGGFASAIGFATIEKGKLLDLSFLDIYQIDSQLTGKEDPPEPIRKALGESTWLLRDANWSPDAPSSSLQIEKMLSRATGRTVDGVVYLPTTALQTILSETGSVTLPGGEEITSSNIIERVTFGQGVDLETGKQQNMMVSTILSLRKLLEGPSAARAIKGILLALQSGDLVVTANAPRISELLFTSGIDGRIAEAECPPSFQIPLCAVDSVYVVDANLGVNNGDYFLKRERNLDMGISQTNGMTSVLSLRYRNTSPTSARPGGNYRGYTRIYIPIDSVVTSVVEVKQGGDVEVVSDQGVELGKHVIGFSIDVPYGGESRFKITYRRSQPLQVSSGVIAYSLLLQKQPGVADVPTMITIHYPDSLSPLTASPAIRVLNNSLLFYLTGKKTEIIAAEFAAP